MVYLVKYITLSVCERQGAPLAKKFEDDFNPNNISVLSRKYLSHIFSICHCQR